MRLAVTALQAIRDRNKLDTHLVDDVVLGCVMPIGEQGADIARTAAVLAGYADHDPARLRSHSARFSAPVFPGETVSVDLWRDGDIVSFEARVKARDVVVIKGGRSQLV